MNWKKAASYFLAATLLCACVAGLLLFSALASDSVVNYYVDADYAISKNTFPSVKDALEAAFEKSGEWGADHSLVITVNPDFLSSENVNTDKNGNSYGDLLFGVHTIFRANKTRLPITIQASGEDRNAFTLDSFTSGSMACANSYTFKDLTFPISSNASGVGAIVFYAGSGQVRFENVRLTTNASYQRARFGGDNFTKEAFVGWTQDHIDANAKNGIITTSVTLGKGVSHPVTAGAGGGSAAWFGGSTWQGDANILVTPQMTRTELVVDGASAGVLTSRYHTGNAVAESVLRVESGSLTHGVYGCSSMTGTYTGDMSVEINGGVIGTFADLGSASVALFASVAHTVNGNANLTIRGGTFSNPIVVDTAAAADKISGNLNINIAGGQFNATGNTLVFSNPGTLEVAGNATMDISGGTFQGQLFSYAFYGGNAPSNAIVKGNWTTNISGGTFNGGEGMTVAPHADIKGNITATISGGTFNTEFRGAPKTKSTIPEFTLNIMSHHSGDTSKDPVFNSKVFPGWFAMTNLFKWNISGGTFKNTTIAAFTSTSGTPFMKEIQTTVSGNPTFSSNYICFGTGLAGTDKVTVTINDSPSLPLIGAIYGGVTVGDIIVNMNGNPTVTNAASGFGHGTYAGGGGGVVSGDLTINISGSPIFKSSFDGVGEKGTVKGNLKINITGSPTFKDTFSDVGKGTVEKDVTTNISGGKFQENISLGTSTGSARSVRTVISGGTFQKELLHTQSDTLTLGEQGKNSTIKIYSDFFVQADAVLGSVTLEQQQQWKKDQIYLIAPKAAKEQVIDQVADGATGYITEKEDGDTIRWIGSDVDLGVVEYYVTDSKEDATHFPSVEKALAAAKEKGIWDRRASLLIHLEKDVAAQVEEGVLFQASTVFRRNNTKLPITLRGNVTLTVGKDAACSNDYRFEGVKLILTNKAKFYAGCGNVVFAGVRIDSTNNGIFCADNFTAAVFRAWTQTQFDALKDQDGKLSSSLTVGEGVCYDVDQSFAAVGFSYASDFTTVQAAQEAKYNFASSAGVDIRPASTRAKLVINTGSDNGATHPAAFSQDADAEIGIVVARKENSPVGDAVVEIQSGIVRRILGTKNANITCVGDITILVTGGTLTNTNTYAIRGVGNYGYKNVLIGNLSITVDEKNGYHTNIPGFIQSVYNSGTITGTGSFTMNGGYVNQVHGAQAMGGTFNTVTGGEITTFTGTHANGLDCRNNSAPFKTVVTNTITGGTFNNFVAGSYTAAHVDHVYNFISGTPDINYYYGGGGFVAGSTVGVAENTFDLAEGARIGLLNCGTRMGGSTTKVDSIINYVKGGTFTSFNAGSYNNGVTGSVKNVITGGVFTVDFYACNVDVDSIETVISGGEFKKDVFLGTSTGGAESVRSVISGGTFRKEIHRTQGDILTLGENGKSCTVKLYSDATLQADSVLGSVTLQQQKQWKSGTIYLIVPKEAKNQITIATASGAYGSLDERDEGDTVRWIGCAFYGVRLALQDKIVVKLYFSKAAVQMWGEGWNVTVDSPEIGFSQRVTEKDLVVDSENGDYYYALPPVAASSFHKNFEMVINGGRRVNLSVMEVCKVGQQSQQGNGTLGLAQLYESIYDLGLKACETFHDDDFAKNNQPLGKGYQGTLGEKVPVRSGSSQKLNLTGASLELSNAMGIRIYGQYDGNLPLEKLSVWVDDVKISPRYYELLAVDESEGNGNFCVVLRVKASRFTSEMRVEVRGESGESASVSGVSVVSVANMNSDEPELIDALLAYVEATVGYIRGTKELITWDKINSFPIATDEMTTDELRTLVVDFFRFCRTFPWVPSEDYYEVVNNKPVSLTGGVVYGGLPYVAVGHGSVYRLMDFYNENTGEVDIVKAFENNRYFGNQCSSGAFVAWGRVVNSAAYNTTEYMVPKNGFIKLGNYVYDENLDNFKTDVYTSHITQANGRQVMYESYALLQPADGLVHWTPRQAGHVIMSTSKAVVVRNPDGTINGDESYVTIIDQAGIYTLQAAQNTVDWVASFTYLYDNNYLPFTFAELLGTDPVEKSVTTFSHTGDTVTVDQLKTATVDSNYAISDVYLTVKDSFGNEVYTKVVRPIYVDYRSLSVGSAAQAFDGIYADGGYTLEVRVQLYTGERPVVYTGELVR